MQLKSYQIAVLNRPRNCYEENRSEIFNTSRFFYFQKNSSAWEDASFLKLFGISIINKEQSKLLNTYYIKIFTKHLSQGSLKWRKYKRPLIMNQISSSGLLNCFQRNTMSSMKYIDQKTSYENFRNLLTYFLPMCWRRSTPKALTKTPEKLHLKVG